MAYMNIDFHSHALARSVSFQLALPGDWPEEMEVGNPHYDRPMKTLFLLHGHGENHTTWGLSSCAHEFCHKYNMAMVMPAGENSFYLNSKGAGFAYETYIAEDLMGYVRRTFGIATRREDTYIGGLSMGGFGAIHTGYCYPETFGKIFGFSSAVITGDLINLKPGETSVVGDYDYYERIFGPLDQLAESHNNPEYVLQKLLADGKEIPPLYMACGTEDELITVNREFRDRLKELGVPLEYHESTGIHNWTFWNEYFEPVIQWLIG